jgi:chemotaxis protein methyltransferase CheR
VTAASLTDLERFQIGVMRHLGLQFDPSQSGRLKTALRRRAHAAGVDVDRYLRTFDAPLPAAEVAALAAELTTPETYFFRNIEQFRALTDAVLPAALARRNGWRGLRILSAGCASGEEPYSIAMSLRDAFGSGASDAAIVGFDIHEAMLERARRGRYSAWSLRETPDSDRSQWFRAEGREFVLDPAIRSAVTFERRNLVGDGPLRWDDEPYDVAFCRNVIMYFSPEQARRAIDRLASALTSGGVLFLGHAETLRGLSNAFSLRHTHGTFYYERTRTSARSSRRPAPGVVDHSVPQRPAPREFEPLQARAGAPDATTGWMEAIQLASDRVRALTETPSHGRQVDRPAEAGTPPDMSGVLQLMQRERFADALALLDAQDRTGSRDAVTALVRVALLAHTGDFAAAETACRELLAADGLNAEAHYLLALCRDGAGDRDGARRHDELATHLDPGFAMPHLHLGLLARRDGTRDAARAELEQALLLIAAEDPSRIMLFGGGFSRDALIALCRAELARNGGRI